MAVVQKKRTVPRPPIIITEQRQEDGSIIITKGKGGKIIYQGPAEEEPKEKIKNKK